MTVFGSQYSTGFILNNCIRESVLHRTFSSITIFGSQCSSGLLPQYSLDQHSSGLLLNNLLDRHSSGLFRVTSAGSALLWASPGNFCWISSPLGFSSITCWIALLWASPGNSCWTSTPLGFSSITCWISTPLGFSG